MIYRVQLFDRDCIVGSIANSVTMEISSNQIWLNKLMATYKHIVQVLI